MDTPESIQEQHENAWERFQALKNKKIPLSDTGKAAFVTAVGAPAILEGVAHMGNIGAGISIAAVIFSFAQGKNMFRAGRWLKDKIVEDNGMQPQLEARSEGKSFKDRFVEQNTRFQRPEESLSTNRTRASRIGRQSDDDEKGVLLGTDKRGREIRKVLKDLQSALILGLPGQGKSTTACNAVSQLVEDYGAKIILVDRHARSKESLTAMLSPWQSAFLNPPAREYSDMVDAFELADQILDERIDTDEAPFPVVLVVDEMTSLLQKEGYSGDKGNAAKKCAEVVENWNEEGRKYLCFCICIGQLTNASRTGGTEVRQLFSSFFVHGMAESQASMVLGREHKAMVNGLSRGECVLLNTNSKEEPFVIKVPGLKKKPVPIRRDPLEELAAMDDVDPYGAFGNHDDDEPEDQIIPIGRDNKTKQEVGIPKQTFDMLVRMRKANNPQVSGYRGIQELLDCSETHARNINKLIDEACENGRESERERA